MYGWLAGMVFSKLALSCSRVACQPSSAVTSAHSSTTTRRWLNSARSTSEPERGSKVCERHGLAQEATGITPWMDSASSAPSRPRGAGR